MAARIGWLGTAIVFAASSLVCVGEVHAAFGMAGMTFTGVDGLSGEVTYYDKETLSSVTTSTVTIGQLTWDVTSSTDPLVTVGPNFPTFCIELEKLLSSPATFDVGFVRDAPDPGTSSPFPSGDIGLAREILLTKLYDSEYFGLSGSTDFAAFQLAVWELTHETTSAFSVSTGSGTFYLSSGANALAVSTANTWLAALSGPAVTHVLDIYALTKSTNQDQIFAVPTPPQTCVPEATAMMTWGLVLFSASFVSRRARAVV